MTPRFLVGINVLVLGVSALAAIEFAAPLMRILWLAVASSVGINGIWHLQATLRTRRYSPGVATGTLLYALTCIVCFRTLRALRLDIGARCAERRVVRRRVLDFLRRTKAVEARIARDEQSQALRTALVATAAALADPRDITRLATVDEADRAAQCVVLEETSRARRSGLEEHVARFGEKDAVGSPLTLHHAGELTEHCSVAAMLSAIA